MPGVVVSDTGPLITLEKLPGGFGLLRRLYDQILVPEQVLDELAVGFETASAYLGQLGIADFVVVATVDISQDSAPRDLDAGEAAAIALAESRSLPLLIEERVGRKIARDRGLQISGIAGQVLKAQRAGLITLDSAEHMIRDLYKAHRINRELFDGLVTALRPRRAP